MPIARRPFLSAFEWDAKSSQYRSKVSGRFVSRDVIRGSLERALNRAKREIDLTGANLQNGLISVDQWREQMATHVKSTHLYSAAIPRGGWAQLTSADFGRVGRLVRFQYERLNKFALELAAGKKTDGSFRMRARMYAGASMQMYHESERVEMKDVQGMTHERNVRTRGDSCDGCVHESSRGWVPIGKLRPIGTRTCLTNCRCHIRYRSGDSR